MVSQSKHTCLLNLAYRVFMLSASDGCWHAAEWKEAEDPALKLQLLKGTLRSPSCRGRPRVKHPNYVCLQYICRIGTVHRITDRGDVRVQYSNNIRWTFHPGALTKVLSYRSVSSRGDPTVGSLTRVQLVSQ